MGPITRRWTAAAVSAGVAAMLLASTAFAQYGGGGSSATSGAPAAPAPATTSGAAPAAGGSAPAAAPAQPAAPAQAAPAKPATSAPAAPAQPPATAPSAAGSPVSVALKEFSITPPSVTAPGRTARFTVTNSGTVEHNLTVELPGQGVEKTLFDTNLKPGETRTAEFTFTSPGRWEMYCPVDGHKARGMEGVIAVAAGAAGSPTQLPQTGGAPGVALPIAVALGALLVGGGLLLGRRRRPA